MAFFKFTKRTTFHAVGNSVSGPFDLAAYKVNCSTYILFIQSAFEIFNIIQNDVTTHLKGAKNNTSQWKYVLQLRNIAV